jgi:hypothetical protein
MKRIILFSLVLSGCASVSDLGPANYSGADPNAMKRDSATCELEGEKVRTNYGTGGLAGAAYMHESRNRAYDACMRSKGYSRVN